MAIFGAVTAIFGFVGMWLVFSAVDWENANTFGHVLSDAYSSFQRVAGGG